MSSLDAQDSNPAHIIHPKKLKKPWNNRQINNMGGSSSDILKYAETTQYDSDAHKYGIYKARQNVYCPEVIDFNLNAEKESQRPIGETSTNSPRLRGLGDKIVCLKHKYFGRTPLPEVIFKKPAESKQIPIKMESMEQFLNEMKRNVHSPSKQLFSFP